MMSRNIVRKAKICWWKFSISPEHEKKIVARLPLLRRAIFNIIKIVQSGDGEKGRLSLVVDIPSGPVSPQHSAGDTATQHSNILLSILKQCTDRQVPFAHPPSSYLS